MNIAQLLATLDAKQQSPKTHSPDIPVDDRGPRATAARMVFPLDENGRSQNYLGLRVTQVKNDPKTWRYQPYEVFVPSSEFTYDSEGVRYPVSSVTPDLPRRGQLGFSEKSYSRFSGLKGILHNFERAADAITFAQKVGPGTEVIAYDTESLRNTLLADAVWTRIQPVSVLVHTTPPKRGKYHGPHREIWTWDGKDWGPGNKQSFDLDYAQYVNFRVPKVDVALPVGTRHAPGFYHRTNPDRNPTVLDRDAFYIGLSALKQARLEHGKWVWPSMPREDARAYVTPGRPASPKKPAESRAGFDPKVRDRYMKVRAHAQRGVENQRDNARRILLSMEAQFPWLRG
jgi:hypothetical protein